MRAGPVAPHAVGTMTGTAPGASMSRADPLVVVAGVKLDRAVKSQ